MQADVAVCGEHSPCSGQGASSLGALSPGAALFSLRGERPRQPGAWAQSPWIPHAFSLRGERPGQPEAWAPSSRMRQAFTFRGPRACHWSGLRKPLHRNQVLFAEWEGVASLGLSLPLAPPPASFLQRGWAGSSLGFLSPFVLQTASGVFRPVYFSLFSHSLKKLPPTALRAFGPVLTLSNAARSSPFRPHLLVAGAGVWSTFLLGVAFRHAICGPYLIFPPS